MSSFNARQGLSVGPTAINVVDTAGNITAVNVTASGSVTATTFVGAVTGLASNADQLNGQTASFYATASSLSTEASTARSAEGTLTTNLAAEITNRVAADALKAPLASPTFTGTVTGPTFVGALTGTASNASQLNSQSASFYATSASVTSEASTARAAEGTLTSGLAAEASARTSADAALTTNLASEVTNRGTAVSGEASARTSADATLTTNLAAEVTRATASEATLSANIASEVTNRGTAVSGEASARTSADATLTTNLAAEATNRVAAEATLTTNLASEVTNRVAAEATLTANIAAEVTNRGTAVSGEASARTSADATLTTNLAAEVTRATASEATLTTNLASEVTNRVAADALKAPLASPTFTGTVTGPTFVGALTGNASSSSDGLTSSTGTAPLTLTLSAKALTGSISQANTTTSGYLSTTDWNTFNSKQPAGSYLTGNQTITVSGDATGSGNTAVILTLANSGTAAGTYTGVTVDLKGRVKVGYNYTTLAGYGITDAATSTHNHTLDALSNMSVTSKTGGDVLQWNGINWVNKTLSGAGIQPAGSYALTSSLATGAFAAVSGSNTGDETLATIKTKLGVTTLSGSNTGDQTITLTGDVTGSGVGSFVATLSDSGVTGGTYGSATAVPVLAIDNHGRVTSASASAIAIAESQVTGLVSDLAAKATLASPTFTGTVAGITPTMVGLSNVPNIAFSGSNTGDETLATIKTKLGVTTLSGSNTGDQTLPTTLPASDVSAWAKAATKPSYTATEVGLGNVTNDAQVKRSEMGSVSGVATLDTGGKIPASQLPSYVDDVLESANLAAFPVTGETGKIYVALDTNKCYRWSGTAYIYITSGAVDSVAGRSGVVVLTKTDVGLANVPNLSFSGSNTGDQVLPTTLPASDVSAWAKNATKPSYTATEVGLGNVPNIAFSGSNSGDETLATIKSKLGVTTLSGSNTGDQTITLTGDVTGSGVGSFVATLSDSGVTAATYGSATAVPVLAIDNHGRVTSASASAIAIAESQVTGLVSDLAAKATLASPTFTGTVAGITPTMVGLSNVPNIAFSGSNTGDETLATIKTKLGITTLSGSNTGDQVLPTTLPASDVYPWAKAGTKPSYTATEVGLGNVPNLTFSGSNTGDQTLPTLSSLGAAPLASPTFTGTVTGPSFVSVNGGITTATLTTSATTANQIVDSIAIATARTVKYLVSITSGSAYHATEILVIHDGTTAYTNEYGIVSTGSLLASFDANVSSGNLNLLVTPVNAVTTIKVVRTVVFV